MYVQHRNNKQMTEKKRDINIVSARVYIRCLIGKRGSHTDTKRHLVDRIIILH